MAVTEEKLRATDGGIDICAIGFTVEGDLRGYTDHKQACHLALAAGVIGMVFGILGFVLEIVVEKGGAVMIVVKKFIFLGLMILAIVIAVLWIATFVYLIYLWEEKTTDGLTDETKKSGRAVLAFTAISAAIQVSTFSLYKQYTARTVNHMRA